MKRGYYENKALEAAGGKGISEQTRIAVREVLGDPIDLCRTPDDSIQVNGIMPVTVGDLPGIYKHEVKFCLSRMSLFPVVQYGDKRFVLSWTKIRDLAEIAGLFDDVTANGDVGL